MTIKNLTRKASQILAVILSMALPLSTATAMVPGALTVQGRHTVPQSTLTGTATILPAGVSRPFTAATDVNGVFQFTLTGLSADDFADPGSFLQLNVTSPIPATIDIPFQSVPYSHRAAVLEPAQERFDGCSHGPPSAMLADGAASCHGNRLSRREFPLSARSPRTPSPRARPSPRSARASAVSSPRDGGTARS